MQQDAAAVAALIAQDLGIEPGKVGFWDVMYQCERHGGKAYVTKLCPRECIGFCWEEHLIVCSAHIPRRQQACVLIHELAHRLCYSERYAHLNGEFAHKGYPPCLFSEYVARAVEQEFINAGGYALPHKHSLEAMQM